MNTTENRESNTTGWDKNLINSHFCRIKTILEMLTHFFEIVDKMLTCEIKPIKRCLKC